MSTAQPILHMLCGKAASGKSTLCAKLGRAGPAVILSEDEWLHALYSTQMTTLADYVRCSAALRTVMAPHVTALLTAGVTVVLDFQANTVESRKWLRGLLDQTRAGHKLHYLDVPDDICLARLKARNAQGRHPFAMSEAQFRQLSRHFVAPAADEGFDIVHHRYTPDRTG
ncbi:AAA family ATPase [Microbulbifer sp. S227A]|uniref:AAA family ATPase n=1 Tax=Microbulbifer sp. S227A TaxID=3415131 RepID=UPI003C7D99B0